MRALIIGAGIGGPVAAVALQRAGIEATVFEAQPGPLDGRGLFLGLSVNGMRVLRQLDMLEAVMRTDPIPTPEMVFSSTTGRTLGVVANGWLDEETPAITLMRGTLQRTLTDGATARGVEVRFGKRLTDFRADAGGVVARFDDGSEAAGDVLIGADGMHSRVRSRMMPDAPSPDYTGLLNLGGFVRSSGLAPTPGRMHMVWGRRAFFGYTVRGDGEAWWFANVGRRQEPARDELESVPTTAWKDRLRELFAGDPPQIGRLVEGTAEIGAFPIHDLRSLPTWHRGRVVLLGDAAHAVSPSAGQGASLALEDAIVLARSLRDVAPVEAALGRYEALRRARAEKIVAAGRKRGAYKALNSAVAIRLRDLLMPLAFRFFATERSMSWIHDYEVAWSEPVEAVVS